MHEKITLVMMRSSSVYLGIVLLAAAFAALPCPAMGASKASEMSGAVLYRDKGCSYCHGVNGSGGKRGPNLAAIRTDKQWPPEKITEQIKNGGQKMPPFADSLTDAEVGDLVAYLRAKHRPEPPPVPAQPVVPSQPVVPDQPPTAPSK